VSDFDGKVDAVRKKIVATTEGGAITGEERLREHTDQLYGALLSYEGKPGDYEIAYIDALRRELDDVTKEFEQLLAKELPALNESLKAKGQQSTPPSPRKVALNENGLGSGTGLNRSGDPEAPGVNVRLPAGFRLLH
jgi:hypothetical protein